jgi:hypothetical protein
MDKQLETDVEKMNKARELYSEMAALILDTDFDTRMFSALDHLEQLLHEEVDVEEDE